MEPIPQWSDEAVAESFRSEIRARFEAHNKAVRARETAERDAVFRKHPEKRGQPGFDGIIRDSRAWSFYQACETQIVHNTVMIVSPGDSIDRDIIFMFDHTTAAWSRPWIKAVVVDGQPR